MHKEDLENEFIKRYPEEKTALRSFVARCSLTICGKGFEKTNKGIYSCTLSPGTYVTVKTEDSNIFSVQMCDGDIQYECENGKLSEYNGSKEIKEIYKCIDRFRGSVKGAKILFCFDVEEEPFRRCCEAVTAALEIINNGKMQEAGKYINTMESKENFVCGELFGRKNLLFGIDENNQTEYLPFNITQNKIILVDAELKKNNIYDKIKEARKNIAERIPEGVKGLKYEGEDIYEKYVIKEKDMTMFFKNELRRGKMDSIAEKQEENIFLFSKLLGKNAEQFLKLYGVLKKSGMCSIIFPAYNYRGLAAIVKDELVDDFVECISDGCEKEVENTPSFYICDTDDSGIEIMENN